MSFYKFDHKPMKQQQQYHRKYGFKTDFITTSSK